jgi:hypothetical protein
LESIPESTGTKQTEDNLDEILDLFFHRSNTYFQKYKIQSNPILAIRRIKDFLDAEMIALLKFLFINIDMIGSIKSQQTISQVEAGLTELLLSSLLYAVFNSDHAAKIINLLTYISPFSGYKPSLDSKFEFEKSYIKEDFIRKLLLETNYERDDLLNPRDILSSTNLPKYLDSDNTNDSVISDDSTIGTISETSEEPNSDENVDQEVRNQF